MSGKKLWGIILVCGCVCLFVYSCYNFYQIYQAQAQINGLNNMFGGMAKEFSNKMLEASGTSIDAELLKSKILYGAMAAVSVAGAFWGTKLVNAKP